ncbi:MAG: PKD domain-containing protein [Planctomycetota bacterium]|nr:MAG: PKD domain-containing protein [Planctomycetota bacterium]
MLALRTLSVPIPFLSVLGVLLTVPCRAAACAVPAPAQQLPAGFFVEPVGHDWDSPVGLAFLVDGRLLVSEKKGRVWYVQDDVKKNLVLDLSVEVLSRGDYGLLGLAVDLAFDMNGYVYLLLVVDPNGDGVDDDADAFGRLLRYRCFLDGNGELQADLLSRQVLIGADWNSAIPVLELTHGVGCLRFLSDASLVLTAGDGAHATEVDVGGLDPGAFLPGRLSPDQDQGAYRSQYPATMAGKILRVDPATGLGLPDNPFYTGNPADAASRVYASGLRNPFRLSLLPGSGPRETLFVSDVGWDNWEEVNLVRGGENFGWPVREGLEQQQRYAGNDPFGYGSGTFTEPLLSWHHSNPGSLGFTGNCATASAVYTGTSYPSLYHGALFFCDYERGWMRCARLDAAQQVQSVLGFGQNMGGLVALESDPLSGDLVFIALSKYTGPRIRRIRYSGGDLPPQAVASADPHFGPAPLAVQLRGSDSSDPEGSALSYHWEFGDGAESSSADPVHDFSDPLAYRARLTVTDAQMQSSSAEVLITPDNTPPEITAVFAPQDGQLYTPGDFILLQASATDREDASAGIPLQAVWHVNLIHDHHQHPDWALVNGPTGVFQTEAHGDGTYYEVVLEVTDSKGLETSEKRSLYDAATEPRAHIRDLPDAVLRLGQPLLISGELLYPGPWNPTPPPALTWDFGDGGTQTFEPVTHLQEVTASHRYEATGTYTVRLTATAGTFTDFEEVSVRVERPRPAVAVFAPLATERWISVAEQEVLANGLVAWLAQQGSEAALFQFQQQDQMARWMDGYLDDSTRDVVVLLDVCPAALYSGEDDGSLAERWIERRNGIVWTGQQPFFEYVRADGTGASNGAGSTGVDEVLDAVLPLLCPDLITDQAPLPLASLQLPSLAPFSSLCALRLDRIGSDWQAGRLYATDGAGSSDALALRHRSGGFYAQFYCTPAPGHPRLEVLQEFLRSYLLHPHGISPQ